MGKRLEGMTIFVDMDEVLTDFVGGACRAHGFTNQEVAANRAAGEWSIQPALAKLKGKKVVDDKEFWEPIHHLGSRFWEELHPLPWFGEMIKLVNSLTDSWYIVTAPSKDPHSYSGKAIWIARYFAPEIAFHHMIPTPNKYLLANPDTILIDDREETVRKFRNTRHGKGCVFPSLGNSLYKYADDPVGFLKTHYFGE